VRSLRLCRRSKGEWVLGRVVFVALAMPPLEQLLTKLVILDHNVILWQSLIYGQPSVVAEVLRERNSPMSGDHICSESNLLVKRHPPDGLARRLAATFGILCAAALFPLIGGSAGASSLVSQTSLPGNCIPQFQVPVPVFGPAGAIPRVDAVSHNKITVTMKEIDQAVLPVGMQSLSVDGCPEPPITFQNTRVWAYEISDTKTGKILGPANWPAVTIEARRRHDSRVTYVNDLPSFDPHDPTGPGPVQGLLDVDQTLHWADPLETGCGMPLDCEGADKGNYCCNAYTGPQPVVPHQHGGEISTCYDGNADQWFTPDGRKGRHYCTDGNPPPGQDIYTYQNSQEPGTLWFHDHALGTTGDNVRAGLAGFYFLRDPSGEPKGLPSGPYEIEMAIQDRLFDTNSQLRNMPPASPHYHPFWAVNFTGDVATVNGAAWPYLKVEPRRYRFRILNGANGRRFDMHFGGAPVWQIGADDNYFDAPVLVNNRGCTGGTTCTTSDVSLTPGERADIIVDFTKLAAHTITVTNSYLSGSVLGLTDILQFKVVLSVKGRDHSCDPANPDPVSGFCARRTPMVRLTDQKGHVAPGVKVDRVREFVIHELNTVTSSGEGEVEEFVNNTYWNGLLSPSIRADFPKDGVSETPRVGSIRGVGLHQPRTSCERLWSHERASDAHPSGPVPGPQPTGYERGWARWL